MKIKVKIYNGRKIIYGTATPEEVESLNIEKNFDTALRVLGKMRKTRRVFFNNKESDKIDRTIYGNRQASRK